MILNTYRRNALAILLAITLSAIFTTSIILVTFILPSLVNNVLRQWFGDYWPYNEETLKHLDPLRPVGYILFTILTGLIITGIALDKKHIPIPDFYHFYISSN